jgi:DNA-binding Lrp family transcriptional regulator
MSYEPSPIDLLIVLALGTKGPAETRTIAKVAGTTIETASQRLYKLTALDIIEPSLSLYNQAEAAEWGFAGNIENSAVGKLPSDSKKAAQLVRDDMIRRQVETGLSHQEVADELGLTRRTVIKSVDRARALRPPVPNISTSTLDEPH